MANPYSGFAKGFREGRTLKQNQSSSAVDELVKMAQLKELGYDIQPGRGGLFGGGMSITQRPDYVSTKDLERRKLENDLDPEYAAKQAGAKERELLKVRQEMFGGGSSFGGGAQGVIGQAGDPKAQYFMGPDGKIRANKAFVNLDKPLSGEAAGKLSGAEQGLGNTRDIRNTLGLKKDQFGNVQANKNFRGQLFGARAANFNLPIPGIGGVVNTAVQAFAGDDARKLDLYYQTLAENNLRARTGAAATEPEIRREKARLMGRVFENPTVIEERLAQSDEFLGGTAENIRPGSSAKFGQQPEAAVPQGVDPEEYAKAKQLGYSDEEIIAYLQRIGVSS